MFVMWGPDPGVFMGVMDCSNHGSVVSGRGWVSKQAKWTRTVGECSKRAGPPFRDSREEDLLLDRSKKLGEDSQCTLRGWGPSH